MTPDGHRELLVLVVLNSIMSLLLGALVAVVAIAVEVPTGAAILSGSAAASLLWGAWYLVGDCLMFGTNGKEG
jgi:hypothetical protein